jgi:hypothetical protein
MNKLNFWSLLKYFLIKIVLTGFFYAFTGQQGFQGWAVILGGTVLFTSISIVPISLIFFFSRSYLQKTKLTLIKEIFMILILLLLNEASYAFLFPENTFKSIAETGNYTELMFKICDAVSVIISGYLFYILPIKRNKAIVNS